MLNQSMNTGIYEMSLNSLA